MDTVVTQGQYRSIMGTNPVWFENEDNCPVVYVTWNEFQELVNKLNAMKDELGIPAEWYFSLPTEALWEYARHNFGEPHESCDEEGGDRREWRVIYSSSILREVRNHRSTRYGFYDFDGDVREWRQYDGENRLTESITDLYDDESRGAGRRESNDVRNYDLGARLA